MSETRRKPTIWAFSISRLKHVFESVAPLYAEAADIRVFDKAFEDAVQAAHELVRSGEHVDAIIAAGAHGAYLHDHTEIPVVLVTPTATDILHALADARRFSRRIAFLNFRTPLPGLDPFIGAHGLEVEQRAYVTLEDAEASLLDLAAGGFEVVVAPGPVCDIAQGVGLRAVLLHARSSACDAIDRAIEVARLTRAARERHERVAAVLDHIEEAVVAVDMEERIHSANRAVERLLGVPAATLVGKPLSTVASELSVARVLGSGTEELGAVHRIAGRTLVVNRIPLREHGVQIGAVLTCQDPGAIQRVDRSLRSEHRPVGSDNVRGNHQFRLAQTEETMRISNVECLESVAAAGGRWTRWRAAPWLLLVAIVLAYCRSPDTGESGKRVSRVQGSRLCRESNEAGPGSVVQALYRDFPPEGKGAVQNEPKEVLSKYFDSRLTNLFLKDVECRDRVEGLCNITASVLVYAQDAQLSEFRICAPTDNDKPVVVSFVNFGHQRVIEYYVVRVSGGWRISDVRYYDGNSLVDQLSQPVPIPEGAGQQ